jgi:RNA polymerase sigma-70 factor (ECF subfamily)
MTDKRFENLVRPEIDRLYRFAYRLTDSRADAEDLVQEVLVTAFERRDELSSIEALGPWLARVLYNRFVDQRRRYERRRLRIVDVGADGGTDSEAGALPSAEEAAALELDIRALRAALAELSREQRVVVLMHDSEGYKLTEIQAITGTELGTLKSRLHRGRARLREILAARGSF